MNLSPAERETVINMSDGDRYATITTYQRSLLNKLRANPEAELVDEWLFFGTAGATFKIPARLVSVRRPYKFRSAIQQPLVTRMDPIAC